MLHATPEATTDTITRPAIDGAQYLPLSLCRANAHNPRKRFAQKPLDELADSIEKFGVMQPVLARPIADAKRGAAQFEIVAGERRWRACTLVAQRRKEAGIAVIPAIVRELSDFEALELMTTENLQREDLHPLEEAEGYEGLLRHPVTGGEFKPPRLHGYSVDELAARLGKSRGYLFARLKLLALEPAARDAFYADKFSASVALLLARMPAKVQAEALKDVVDGWGGEPLSYRSARDMLERNYMLKLAAAPFKITDESLVPGAGSCKECPKRTGASPDLFDDVKGADLCTDAGCFAAKKDAHHARLIAIAKEEGREVILGAAAKKVSPTHYGELKGYLQLDKIHYNLSAGDKPLAKLLGKDAPPIALLEDPHTHELVQVVRTDDALAVLKDKGLIKTARLSQRSDAERKAEAKAKTETAWRTALAERAVAAVANNQYAETGIDVHAWLLPEVAIAMWMRLESETEKRVEKLLGWERREGSRFGPDGAASQLDKRIRELTSAQLDQLFVAMAVAGQLHVGQYSGEHKPARLLQIAGRLGIDGAAVRAELDAAGKAKEKKKPAAKKAKAEAVAPSVTPTKVGAQAKPSMPPTKRTKAPPPSGEAPVPNGAAHISSEAAWPWPGDAR